MKMKLGILCDVTLKVEDKLFLAHKDVLATSSGYFRGMFTNDLKESHMKVVNIYDIEATIFELIIQYIYTGSIQINDGNVKKLWIAFDYFDLLNARENCAIFLLKRMKNQMKRKQNDESLFDLMEIRYRAQLMGNTHLVSTVEKLIGFDMKNLMKSREFLELNVENLCDLIESNNLFSETEEIIFEAGMNWIRFREEERIILLPKIFPKIRLNLLSKNFLEEKVFNNPIIKESEICRILVQIHLNNKEKFMENSRSRCYEQVGQIYVISGTDCEETMEKYNPDAKMWHELKNIPSKRIDMGVAVVKGKIYILGGDIEDSPDYESTVEVFDPKTNVFSKFSNMLVARSCPAVAVNENLIYVCGGANCVGTLKSVECFNLDTNSWSTLPPMMTPRKAAVAVTLNNFIYVMGGFDIKSYALNSVERFDPKNNSWEVVKPMLIKRASFGAAILQGKIYACGGENGEQTFKDVEVYNPNQNKWEIVKSMNVNRANVAVVSYMDKIWAIGGISNLRDEDTTLECVEAYDPDTDEWDFEQPMKIKRESHVACVVI